MPGDRDRFIMAGFDGYISKPFTRRELLESIEMALDPKKSKSTKEAVKKNTKPALQNGSKQQA